MSRGIGFSARREFDMRGIARTLSGCLNCPHHTSPPGTSRGITFKHTGIVRVFCNIHPTMSAIILVLNTPWFVTTAKNGSFEMNVPPGEYELSFFHERATDQGLTGLARRVMVAEPALRVPLVMISENNA